MRKIFLVLLTLCMLACFAASPAAMAEETVTLDWFINRSALPSNWNMNEPIFKTITDATGVQCNFNIPAEDAATKLNLLMISGNMPDLITTDNGDLIREMIDAGQVWNLQELMETYYPDAQMLKEFPEDLKEAMIKRDGGWYCYPSHMITNGATAIYGYPTEEIADYYHAAKYDTPSAIYLYKDYVDKLSIDVDAIKTETDLMNVLAQIAAANLTNDAGASVYTMMTDGIYTVPYSVNEPLANMFGATRVSDDGQYQNLVYSDEYRDAVSFLNNCAQLGYLTETQMIMDEPSVVSVCNSGRSACFVGSLSTLKSGGDVVDSWVSVGAIAPDSGASPVLPHSETTSTGWLSTLVAKKVQDPAACARFMDYMASREGLVVHMYGMEGTDYYYDEQGCLHRTDDGSAKIEDGVTGMFGFYAFHNTAFQRSVEWKDVSKNSPSMKYGSSDNVVIYDSSVFELPSGYIEGGSDEAFIQTETSNYIRSEIPKIILSADTDAFNQAYDAFLTKLDELGLRTLDSFINEQVQRNCQEQGVTLSPIN